MHNTIINAPGRYYDAETADWKNCKADVSMAAVISSSVAGNIDSGVQQLAANCCGSDVLQRHFTHSEKWFYTSLHFIYFWACGLEKKHTSKQRRILMVELWMLRVDMPPAGHGPTLFTQLLMDNRPKLWLWPAAWSKFEKDDKDPHSNGNKQHVPRHHT